MSNQHGVVRGDDTSASMTTLENGDAHVSVLSDEAANETKDAGKVANKDKEVKKSEGGFKYFLVSLSLTLSSRVWCQIRDLCYHSASSHTTTAEDGQ